MQILEEKAKQGQKLAGWREMAGGAFTLWRVFPVDNLRGDSIIRPMDNSGTELEIIQKLTAKERMFAITYAQNSNISAAARAAGYAKSSAQKCGQVLLRKPHVKAYISLLTTQYALSDSQIIDQARRKRIEMLPKALETVGAVMGMVVTQPAAALSAAKDVQDRVEGKPNQSVDLSPGKGAAMIAYVWGGDGT